MSNPDPARITDPMWKLWTDRANPDWLLSGFYADKKGYHNTVIANKAKWPGNYSIRVPLDLVPINRDKTRGMDLTMSDTEMVKWTSRMRKSALDPADNRLACLREFYGTLDNKTVYGLIKDTADGPWRQSSADDTHLWHGHKSFFTAFVNNWEMLAPSLSVESGESFEDWISNVFLPKFGETGEEVKYWQTVHNFISKHYTPPMPIITVDGIYGATTASAFVAFYRKLGGTSNYDGKILTGWMGSKYHQVFAIVSSPPATSVPVINPEQLKELVNEWFAEHIPGDLTLTADLKGKITL